MILISARSIQKQLSMPKVAKYVIYQQYLSNQSYHINYQSMASFPTQASHDSEKFSGLFQSLRSIGMEG
jgi:hypothetical protein